MQVFWRILALMRALFRRRIARWIAIAIGILIPVVAVILTDMSVITARKAAARELAEQAALAAIQHLDDPEAAAKAAIDPEEKAYVEVFAGHVKSGEGPVEERFSASSIDADSVEVAVTLTARAPFSDRFGLGRYRVTAVAVAQRYGTLPMILSDTATGADPQIMNAVYSAVFNGTMNLSDADYANLAAVKIPIGPVLTQLALAGERTDADVGAVVRVELLPAVILKAMADSQPEEEPAKSVLSRMAEVAGPARPLRFSDLVDLAKLHSRPVGSLAPAELPVMTGMELLTAMARIQSKSGTFAFSLKDPEAGISSIEVAVTADRESETPPSALMAARGDKAGIPLVKMVMIVNITGSTLPGISSFRLPLYFTLFGGKAEVTKLACDVSDFTRNRITVAATPVRANLAFAIRDEKGDISMASEPAPLVETRDPAPLIDAKEVQAWIQGGTLVGDGEPAILDFILDGVAPTTQSVSSNLYFSELVERYLTSSEILVKSPDDKAMPAGAVRDDLAGLIGDHALRLGARAEDIFAALGLSPTRIDVRLGDMNCTNARLVD